MNKLYLKLLTGGLNVFLQRVSHIYRSQQSRHRSEYLPPSHLDKDLFQCLECGKVFTTETSLKQHIKTVHQRQFRYHCNICGKGMRELRDMNGHMAFKHNMQKAYKCSICGEEFGYKRNIDKHMTLMHGSLNWKWPLNILHCTDWIF